MRALWRLAEGRRAARRSPARRARARGPLVASATCRTTRFRTTRSAPLATDPHYNPETDTYRVIHRGHDNASAVTSEKGVTVYFDPDTHDVLGFAISNFTAYYQAHVTPEGDFEVDLPAKVPPNLEEEMDYDAEAVKSGIRIAEFY